MMTRKTSKSAILLPTLLGFVLTGCATTGIEVNASPSVHVVDISYQVRQGDRLSNIALRLTGKASNWQAIAARNDIANPRTLAIGKVLIIPGELLEDEKPLLAGNTERTVQRLDAIKTSSAGSPVIDAFSTESRNATQSEIASRAKAAHNATAPPVTTGAGVSTLRSPVVQKASNVEDSTSITVSAVRINRTFDLQPIEKPMAIDEAGQRYDSEAPRIRVTGTYYPKGVYEQPANYSQLIGRAAPGTLFDLESEVNDWYKITTDQGVGYIRRSDGSLVR